MSDELTARLPFKQRRWLEAYLLTWNATEAARQAGYAHPNVQGSRLLSKVSIRAAIKARLSEKAMEADELLARLADEARANIADFLQKESVPVVDDDGRVVYVDRITIDFDAVRERGYLIKKISHNSFGPTLELYDGQAAKQLIGKHLKLFTDQVDLTSAGKPIAIIEAVPPEEEEDAE